MTENNPDLEDDFKNAIREFTGYEDLGNKFWSRQPVYYDNAGIWWLWNKRKFKWVMSDVVDLMIRVDQNLRAGIITERMKNKSEIIEALKKTGRRHKPKELDSNWIQFKNELINIKTGETKIPCAGYFCINPIPWNLSEGDTPIIDEMFRKWAGEDTELLHETTAYCLLSDYPIHRIFAHNGDGSNGKSTYQTFVTKLVGKDNVCSTDLDTLINRPFEKSKLYKKLVCLMGETDMNRINKTSLMKKLSGQDLVGVEFKQKTPFDNVNYAKLIVATNSLPITTDKTNGFYRRWLIVDFKNRFSGEVDILKTIPDQEYKNYLGKCIVRLKNLLNVRKFNSQGSIEDRKQKYEERSNPITTFVNKGYIKNPNGTILFSTFFNNFMSYLKVRGMREQTAISTVKGLKEMGFESGLQNNKRVYFGLEDRREWKS